MRTQLDLNYGCIPACALHVMETLSPGVGLPTESELIECMKERPLETGFAQLDHAVRKLDLPYRVKVVEPATLDELASVLDRSPLVCIDPAKPFASSTAAHCWVLVGRVSGFPGGVPTTVFHYLDPNPHLPDVVHFCGDDTFESKWTGGFALIEVLADTRQAPRTQL